ncbi:hypothetical protein HAX54_010910, partial [Datura stramonium]|nr:hypothetical protein [Datura stramonium]
MEYRPISSWETSHQIMGEFLDICQETIEKKSLPGNFMHIEPNFSEYDLSDQYTSQHTAPYELEKGPRKDRTRNLSNHHGRSRGRAPPRWHRVMEVGPPRWLRDTLGLNSVAFLGHIVSDAGIQVDTQKIAA